MNMYEVIQVIPYTGELPIKRYNGDVTVSERLFMPDPPS